ncbi:Cyclin-O [Acipenser ruthenus]|uniref:Cyclin-O n=1 Tax=Acipenser ruthenus TaxID=7906 RepID=A0A444UXJ3_ACIRT|nr:Cyclin-O [Acipenser ruthenus]
MDRGGSVSAFIQCAQSSPSPHRKDSTMVVFTLYECTTKQISPSKRKRQGNASGNEDVTPEDRVEALISRANMRAPVKKARHLRHRKQKIESMLSDSGIEEDFETPSPSPSSDAGCDSPMLGQSHLSTPLIDWQNFREYGDTCYYFQRNNEERYHPVNCLSLQPQVTAEARCKLISWLIPVHRHFNLCFESFCLAVNIMDRFLMTTPVASDCFQLLGVTSLLIACKQVEVYPPRIKQLLALCCDAFTKDQLCNLECIILIKLNFSLTAPTLAFFLEHFTKQRLEGGDELCKRRLSESGQTKNLARTIAELSLADYAFNRYPASLLAICSIRLADQMMDLHYTISQDLSGYPQSVVEDCTESLRLLVSLNGEVLHSLAEL